MNSLAAAAMKYEETEITGLYYGFILLTRAPFPEHLLCGSHGEGLGGTEMKEIESLYS